MISLFPNKSQRWDCKMLPGWWIFKHCKSAMYHLESFGLGFCGVLSGKMRSILLFGSDCRFTYRPLSTSFGEWLSLCSPSAWVKTGGKGLRVPLFSLLELFFPILSLSSFFKLNQDTVLSFGVRVPCGLLAQIMKSTTLRGQGVC